jgi:cystathionine beta-lyase
MDFRVAPPIVEAAARRVAHGIFGYSQPTPELIETVLAYFARRWQWKVAAEWLVFSPGLGVAIHTACRAIGEVGDAILTPTPIYHVFRRAPQPARRKRIDAPMVFNPARGEWELPIETLAANNDARIKLLQLCSPHNPNGKVFNAAELSAIAELALARGWVICADDVHADLIFDEDKTPYTPIAALGEDIARRTITLQSPSKAFNIAGLNFAVAVIPDSELRARYCAAAYGQVLSHLNPVGLAAAQAAWSGECDNWRRELLHYLRANRDMLAAAADEIPQIKMPPLSATYLAWLDISGLKLADAPAHFQAHGLGMSAGEDFGDKNYMRLNFACPRATLNEAIARLREAAR